MGKGAETKGEGRGAQRKKRKENILQSWPKCVDTLLPLRRIPSIFAPSSPLYDVGRLFSKTYPYEQYCMGEVGGGGGGRVKVEFGLFFFRMKND